VSSVLEGGARSLVAAEGGVRCACAMGVRAPAPGSARSFRNEKRLVSRQLERFSRAGLARSRK